MPLEIVFFGASKLASAKTPLLNPYYRLHGLGEILAIWAPRFQITSDLRFVIWST